VSPNRLYSDVEPGDTTDMIKKVVTRRALDDPSAAAADLAYWLSRPPEERIEALERLRRQFYGNSARLQRVARVIQRSSG